MVNWISLTDWSIRDLNHYLRSTISIVRVSYDPRLILYWMILEASMLARQLLLRRLCLMKIFGKTINIYLSFQFLHLPASPLIRGGGRRSEGF